MPSGGVIVGIDRIRRHANPGANAVPDLDETSTQTCSMTSLSATSCFRLRVNLSRTTVSTKAVAKSGKT